LVKVVGEKLASAEIFTGSGCNGDAIRKRGETLKVRDSDRVTALETMAVGIRFGCRCVDGDEGTSRR